MLPREALTQVEQISAWFSNNEIDIMKTARAYKDQRITEMRNKISQLEDLLDYNMNYFEVSTYSRLKGQIVSLKTDISKINDAMHMWYIYFDKKVEYDTSLQSMNRISTMHEPGQYFEGTQEEFEEQMKEMYNEAKNKVELSESWRDKFPSINQQFLEANHKFFKDAVLLCKEIIDKSMDNSGDKSNENRNFSESTSKVFKVCPYCGEKLNLPKNPIFCPFCGEKLS